ncbi:MAG: DUF1579 domain-containing protein [Sphingobacteriales bacterium]|nr:MAG: DUF1579 domain-containing protein [Sphingobacteriales bacterium]
MKKTLLSWIAATALLASCNNAGTNDKATDGDSAMTTSTTTETKKDEAFVPVDSATAMKAWMAAMTPGEPHKELAKSDGKWTAEASMWMQEGAPPETSTGTMTNKMVLGGRFQMGEYKGVMMGGPFEGFSLVGYDNTKKKFVSNWIDNMGTGIMSMEGTWDNATKSMNLTGSMLDPATGKTCDMKEVFTMVDNDHQTMEMWGQDPKTGKSFKTMEIKFTRVK